MTYSIRDQDRLPSDATLEVSVSNERVESERKDMIHEQINLVS